MPRILVAEDRVDFRLLYCEVLRIQGFEVVEAENTQAIELGFEEINLVGASLDYVGTDAGFDQ